MRYGQIVMGPAGCGKVSERSRNGLVVDDEMYFQSTYCSNIVKHCQTVKRSVHVINLDPAAEHFDYPVDVGMSMWCWEAGDSHRRKGG